ncbi:MAG: acyl-CoA dehydrogenase [halophilic archaeon J07HX5]|nr:MAG: acyl-CoA dehydrogenase [halophilic archaeon J07HX5]
MEFALSEDHQLIRDSVREFCEAEIEPIAQTIEDDHRFPDEIFDQLADLDVMGVPIAERWGGLGGGVLLYTLVAEELGRVSGSVGLSYVAHVSLGAKPIELYGTETQRERFLKPLAAGEQLGSWALTEPESGSDASSLNTRARRNGDGWRISGTKQFITNASVADTMLVKAVTDPDAGRDGISTFIIDPEQPGVEITTVWDKMGLNASPSCEVQLDNVTVGKDRLLGEPGAGWQQTHQSLVGGRISVAALSVGIARGAFEAARSYATDREQFGQPIGEFDAVRDMLVAMDRKIERARLLTQKAAVAQETGDDAARLSSMAKLEASETAREVAEDAVQVLGGYGYTTEFSPQRFYRDAKLMEIAEGTSEIQRLILGRKLGV